MTQPTLTTPQSDLFWLDAKARYPLFVGGYGSGKTQALITRALNDAVNFHITTAIYQPTFDLIRLIIVPRLTEFLNSIDVKYTFNRKDGIFELPQRGRIVLRSCDRPERIVGYETVTAHVDEIDTLAANKSEDVWSRIIARTREKRPHPDTGEPIPNRVTTYGTPEGFGFTYNRWGVSQDADYQYIRAPSHTNPWLPDDYIPSLYKSYPSYIADAYIEGRWVNMVGMGAFPDFDREANASRESVKPREPLIIGMDFNVWRMCAVVYVLREGLPHAVDEFHNLRDTPDMIKAIQNRYEKHPITIVPDASNPRHSTNASLTDFELIKGAGFAISAPNKNPSVKDRLQSTNGLVLNGEGERRLFVNIQKCPKFTEALEQIALDDKGLLVKGGEWDQSHIADSGTYPLHRLYQIRRASYSQVPLGGT